MRIRTILCPVDRSEISNHALAYATALARQYMARLSVLEVIEWQLPPVAGTGDQLTELPPEVQRDVLRHLNTLTAPAGELGVPTEVAIDAGPVVRRILERASNVSADLIVVGTHGRGGFDRLALGSVAEKVLRKAICPVLTVPASAPAPTGGALFATILCAVDFSAMSADVVRVGVDLARRYRGRLVVTYVVPWPVGDGTGLEVDAGLTHEAETRARDELTRLLAAEAGPAVHGSAIVLTGTPKHEILACARTLHASLIVLGVSGHGAIERALLGSTAHSVVRHSECPVLTVPAPAHKHHKV